MNWWQLLKSDYLKLLPILFLAGYVAFIPNSGYPFLVHIDEWVHLAFSKGLQQAQATTFIDPFQGYKVLGLRDNLEVGYHLYWGVFQQISGISWFTLFRYFPSFIFAITVLSVYVMARREGFGWEAAFFTALIPTTVGVLGPGFMVPVAVGIMFVPISLFLVFNFRTVWSYLALFIIACFLLTIHAPSAIFLGLAIAPFLLINLKKEPKHSLAIVLVLAIPFLAPFPWIFKLLLPTAQALLTPQPIPTHIDFPRVIYTYGYLPIAMCLLGTFYLVVRGGHKSFALILGLLAVLAVQVSFYTFNIGLSILYQRGFMFMMLMVGIIAGAGLASVRRLRIFSFLHRPEAMLDNIVVGILSVALIGATLATVLPGHHEIPYYHMINEQDYEEFVWIEDNVGDDYKKALLDPWKATPFSAITGKNIYTRIHGGPKPIDFEAQNYLNDGCKDTTFLTENGISVIYNPEPCSNPDLTKVRESVYLLK